MEALDVRVLCRFPWFDEVELHTVFVGERCCCQNPDSRAGSEMPNASSEGIPVPKCSCGAPMKNVYATPIFKELDGHPAFTWVRRARKRTQHARESWHRSGLDLHTFRRLSRIQRYRPFRHEPSIGRCGAAVGGAGNCVPRRKEQTGVAADSQTAWRAEPEAREVLIMRKD